VRVRRPLTLVLALALLAPAGSAPAVDCAARAQKLLGAMTLPDRIGQLLMAAVLPESEGKPSALTQRAITDLRVGSILATQTPDPATAAEHNNLLQSWASGQKAPLLIAADFEYGTAHGIGRGTTAFPLQMAVAAARSPGDAATQARITAKEGRAMGFHWSLAPVADVNTNPRNPVIGTRSFGSNPELVGELTAAAVTAYREAGMVSSPKHFPGHGETVVDSGVGLPKVGYSPKTLRQVHLAPFRAAIEAGAEAIMAGHVVVEKVDAKRPATLSATLLTAMLRQELGFGGLIVADDITKGAIANRWKPEKAATLAVKAGADVVMVTGSYVDQEAAARGLRKAVKRGKISRERVAASTLRVLDLKCRYGLLDGTKVGIKAAEKRTGTGPSRTAAAEIGERSVVMLKNKGVLPMPKGGRVLVAGVSQVPMLAKLVRGVGKAKTITFQGQGLAPTASEIADAKRLAKKVDRVVVATYSRGALPQQQADLVEALRSTGTPVVAIALGLPYDIASYRKVPAYLVAATQGPWSEPNPAVKATIRAIYGASPSGKLPVKIPGLYPFGAGLTY